MKSKFNKLYREFVFEELKKPHTNNGKMAATMLLNEIRKELGEIE